jgi:hypothetical protein
MAPVRDAGNSIRLFKKKFYVQSGIPSRQVLRGRHREEKKQVPVAGLLNAIDGVGSPEE